MISPTRPCVADNEAPAKLARQSAGLGNGSLASRENVKCRHSVGRCRHFQVLGHYAGRRSFVFDIWSLGWYDLFSGIEGWPVTALGAPFKLAPVRKASAPGRCFLLCAFGSRGYVSALSRHPPLFFFAHWRRPLRRVRWAPPFAFIHLFGSLIQLFGSLRLQHLCQHTHEVTRTQSEKEISVCK